MNCRSAFHDPAGVSRHQAAARARHWAGQSARLRDRGQAPAEPKYPEVFSVGVCVAIPPMGPTPVPCGVPKTEFMIESMVTATARNIGEILRGRTPKFQGTWNAVCLADFGDTGVAFVAQPANSPAQRQLVGPRAAGSMRRRSVSRNISSARCARAKASRSTNRRRSTCWASASSRTSRRTEHLRREDRDHAALAGFHAAGEAPRQRPHGVVLLENLQFQRGEAGLRAGFDQRAQSAWRPGPAGASPSRR